MWDIGAGSCSVSIEASNLMPNGRIFALERNPQCVAFINENLEKILRAQCQADRSIPPRMVWMICLIRTEFLLAVQAATWKKSLIWSINASSPKG